MDLLNTQLRQLKLAAMAAALREFAAAPPPRRTCDLSAYHLENVLRETVAAYRELAGPLRQP